MQRATALKGTSLPPASVVSRLITGSGGKHATPPERLDLTVPADGLSYGGEAVPDGELVLRDGSGNANVDPGDAKGTVEVDGAGDDVEAGVGLGMGDGVGVGVGGGGIIFSQ